MENKFEENFSKIPDKLQSNSFNNEFETQNPDPLEELLVPPKFMKEVGGSNTVAKSLLSLALYLMIGYFIFKSFFMLLIITVIVLLHELGHFIAMKLFNYKDLGIFFIPLLGAYVSGTKREVSQKESAIILLAGPLPGIMLGGVVFAIGQYFPTGQLAGISLDRIAVLFVLLNMINLLPVYPLDGGQLLNRVFFDEEGWISRLFLLISAALLLWTAWNLYQSSGRIIYFLFFLFPLMMFFRLRTDNKLKAIEEQIEDEGINADVAYEDLPDGDYWRIRKILIDKHPDFSELEQVPPYSYSEKEPKVMIAVQSLLHRHLIQDVSIAGKLLIALICVLAFALPWLLGMDANFLFGQLGF